MRRSIVAYVLALSLLLPAGVIPQSRIKGEAAPKLLNANYFDLSTGNFTQDWSNTGLITANDDWSGVPSIQGFRGDDITAGVAIDPQTLLGEGTITFEVIAQALTTNTSGGIGEFDSLPNPVVGFQGSGTADAPNLVFYVNTSGRQNINVAYNLRDVDGTADNAVQPVALQYRVGTTGDFTNLPAGFVADASSGPDAATLVTPVSATLPAAAENQPQVQIRVITSNALSTDEWIGVDDIVISSQPGGGGNPGVISMATASQTAAEGSGSAQIVVSRTGGSDGSVSVSYGTSDGSAVGGVTCTGGTDYLITNGTLTWNAGDSADKSISVTICDDAEVETDETFAATLSNPSGGATLGTPTSTTVTITDNEPGLPSIQFTTPSNIYDESTTATIQVTRTGDTTGTSTVGFATGSGGSTITKQGGGAATPNLICGLGSDYVARSGVLSFAPGETVKEFSVPICSDNFWEQTESFTIALSGATNAVIGGPSVTTIDIRDTASVHKNATGLPITDNSETSSSINVTGEAGPISTLRVTLYSLGHMFAEDLDVLLVGPGGQTLILMADASSVGLDGVRTLTFVDSAGRVLPQSTEISNGDYEPTSWIPGQPSFSPPAPAGPYNEPGSTVGGGPNLTSVFGGTDPNGVWTLYVRDDNGTSLKRVRKTGIQTGTLEGWGIDFVTTPGVGVSMDGQVQLPGGGGVRGVMVTISGGDIIGSRHTITNNFGYYRFSGLTAGQSYTISFSNRRYQYSPSAATATFNGNLHDQDVVAIPF